MITPEIKDAANSYGVDPTNLELLTRQCPPYDPYEGVGFDLDELANLLSHFGEDVDTTAEKAHRLMGEFGGIPNDIDCVAEGGSQVMYHEIMHGSDD